MVILYNPNYHHERYDGKGYPNGLCGEDIPQIARIIAVADAYDAMTSKRTVAEKHVAQTMIKKIVGHCGAMTLTEKVYTHLDIEVLVEAINEI